MPTGVSEKPTASNAPAWRAVFGNGIERQSGAAPSFTLRVPSEDALDHILATDTYSAAMAFVRGEFDVEGDLVEAVRFKGWQPHSRLRKKLLGTVARCASVLEETFQTKAQAARDIRFHYDRSNEFYQLFLDPRMVYSCAYFRNPEATLEQAQLAKLDHICRKLDVSHGERFLDIGCGWGALVLRAAGRYGAFATGCTLSLAQHRYATTRVREEHLDGCVHILEQDYRDLTGSYDKIASVGMFEHVGRRRAPVYFRKMAQLLSPGGLFLNHAIARAQGVGDDAASLFVRRRIFPGGELIHLYEVIREAENAGFEVLDVENLRPHYARTCRMWEERLTANREAALRLVDEATYRAWRIWLAASSLGFEEGFNSIYQVLMAKRGGTRRRATREYMYPPERS
ncbi:MAG TPA: cyclopropane-fatty-acyl-phospholipid synthase family protein [Bryobacteraceae bacterium]|nr:cyclopropane-fatty-acyl-phospholipid synthase family protein [Bryobacteraceae bacterium]